MSTTQAPVSTPATTAQAPSSSRRTRRQPRNIGSQPGTLQAPAPVARKNESAPRRKRKPKTMVTAPAAGVAPINTGGPSAAVSTQQPKPVPNRPLPKKKQESKVSRTPDAKQPFPSVENAIQSTPSHVPPTPAAVPHVVVADDNNPATQKKILTPEEKQARNGKFQLRREKQAKKDEAHFGLVISAAQATVAILRTHGISCATFGSLACRLYGRFRPPKDVDLLVLQPPSSDPNTPLRTTEELKKLIVDTDPTHYYLKLPRDPEAPYRILYYREKTQCKVDILVPGIMYLPNLLPPPSLSNSNTNTHLITISNIPLVPFSLLLLHKLQGWSDNRASDEEHKQRRQVKDASDVGKLLAMKEMIKVLQQTRPWTNTELFSEEFQEMTKERVKEFCKLFPKRVAAWRMLGFEVV